jgi:hypothetical protein
LLRAIPLQGDWKDESPGFLTDASHLFLQSGIDFKIPGVTECYKQSGRKENIERKGWNT